MPISRRFLVLGSLAMGTALRLARQPALAQARKPTITVYKSPG